MSYACNILADSIGPHGIRLTTFEITFPRFILAELNTHRMLSRNSASSRAIPPEKQIERVIDHPFVPQFCQRTKGMEANDPLDAVKQADGEAAWLHARLDAVAAARKLIALDVDKARVNRLLEPFMWHTAIVSATEWDNFFALRCHPAAQPEFRHIAQMMRDAMKDQEPTPLNFGEWHLPLYFEEDRKVVYEIANDRLPAEVSAGRCARVSYDRQHDSETPAASIERWDRLATSGHWSPGEHPALCVRSLERNGNFRGWLQLRKQYPNEAVFEG